MPHLAPLSWLTSSLIFWLSLLMFSSTTWWQQAPLFPRTKPLMGRLGATPWLWYLGGRA